MDAKEITRLEVMQRQKEAATLLGLSVRQVKRVWQKYRQQAAKGSGERPGTIGNGKANQSPSPATGMAFFGSTPHNRWEPPPG